MIAYSLEDPLLLRLDFYEFFPKVFYTNVINVRTPGKINIPIYDFVLWFFLLKWTYIRQYFEICYVIIQTHLQI